MNHGLCVTGPRALAAIIGRHVASSALLHGFAYAGSQEQFGIRRSMNENWLIAASASGFELLKQQVSATTDLPIVLRLSHVGTGAVPDTQRFPRPCCPLDLFTSHQR